MQNLSEGGKKMKKFLALIIMTAMLVTSLAACSGDSSTGSTDESSTAAASGTSTETEWDGEINYESELIVGISDDIGSMYPGGSASSGVKIKRLMCYEPLFYKDSDGELHPVIAKSYEDLGDGTYSVEIFDYVTDSEGNAFTASDIVFSIDKYIEDGQNSSTYESITSYVATGDYTFEFTVDPERTGQVEDILSRIPMVTEAAWEASGDDLATYPVGTGGYTLDLDASTSGSVYVFVRRDDYWQTDEDYLCDINVNYISKLTVKVITDTATLASALQTGEIDFTPDLESTSWSKFIDDDGNALEGYIVMEGQNNAFVHLTFNCGENSPCQDILLRQAIAYCIDAASIAYSVYGSLGEVCTAATNPNLEDSGEEFGHDDYFTTGDYESDLAYAQELVDQSSYNGETLKMLVLPRNTVSSAAPLIQAYCLQIGIDIEILEYDMATYRTIRVEQSGTEYDIELLGATSADDYVNVSVKELDNRTYGNGLSRVFVDDDTLQELYEATGNENTNSPEAVQALLDYIEENCYIYGMYYCSKLLIGSDKIISGPVVSYNDAIYNAFIVAD